MSQGPVASRSPSSPFQSDRPNLTATRESRTLPPINDSFDTRNSKSAGPGQAATPNVPVSALQTPTGSEHRTSRTIGLSNLLNPTARDPPEAQSRRRNAEHFDMPSGSFGTGPRTFTPSPSMTALPSLTPPPMTTFSIPMDHAPRRILNPRSPSAYVNAPNSFNIPKGTIDAKKSPFGASRELNTILEPDIQSVPEASVGPSLGGAPQSYSGSSARSPPDRRTSVGSIQLHPSVERRASIGATSQVHASQSDSPTTSYSSYSQFSRTPPVLLPNASNNQPSSTGYFPPSYNTPSSATTRPQAGFDSKDSYSPVASAMGQNTYQMMTLDTDQGPIQVPVDVQAASKVADEKRKRNATASHRFRQRRKEKERETSQNIAKLEHQLRELAEEREFYRLERDYFRSQLAKTNSGQAHIAPRPPSPRHVRHAQLGAAAPYVSSQWQAPEESNRNVRNTRRRTSSYVPTQGLAPPTNNPPPHIPRHSHVTSSAETIDGNSRGRLPGPLSLKTGTFDPTLPPSYDNGWKQ